MNFTKKFLEEVEIQIVKRANAGKTSEEILNEMRDSYAEMFIENQIAAGPEALLAGKKLALKVMKMIAEKRNLNLRGLN